jgi:hypothetical protein
VAGCCIDIPIKHDYSGLFGQVMKNDARRLRIYAQQLRSVIEPAFSDETALPGSTRHVPSSGHCAAVAALVHQRLGGWLVSATVGNESHWFNRFRAGNQLIDVDLNGDQFGRAPVQIAAFGRLYDGTRVRRPSELHPETLARCEELAQRAHLASTRDKHIQFQRKNKATAFRNSADRQ